jgi:hypothetical protein
MNPRMSAIKPNMLAPRAMFTLLPVIGGGDSSHRWRKEGWIPRLKIKEWRCRSEIREDIIMVICTLRQ